MITQRIPPTKGRAAYSCLGLCRPRTRPVRGLERVSGHVNYRLPDFTIAIRYDKTHCASDRSRPCVIYFLHMNLKDLTYFAWKAFITKFVTCILRR